MRVEPGGEVVHVDEGETLIEAAWRDGLYWPTTCYAEARCTACRVMVLEGDDNVGPMGEEERRALRSVAGPGVRLACRLLVTGDVVVRKAGVRRES